MFRTVTVQAVSTEDHGKFAEALVFFPRTRLVAGIGELAWLAHRWRGFDVLNALMDLGDLEIILEEKPFAAMPTAGTGGLTGIVNLVSQDDAEYEFVQTWLKNTVVTKANRAAATAFIERTQRHDVGDQVFAGNDADLLNQKLVTQVARRQIASITGAMPTGTLRFEPDPSSEYLFRPVTDLVFPENQAGTLYTKMGPESVVAALAEARREVIRSADGRTDMWLLPHTMDALEAKLSCLAEHSSDAQREVEVFQEVKFQKRSIADAISSGQRSPLDLLKLLEDPETRKWKAWLGDQNPDGHLLEQYEKAVVGRSERFSSAPGKIGSFLVMQGAGLLVSAATGGLSFALQAAVQTGAAGAAELIKGGLAAASEPWRPSQWGKGAAASFYDGLPRSSGLARKPLGPYEEKITGQFRPPVVKG